MWYFNIAIENGSRTGDLPWFTNSTWWFSIAMLVYQRACRISIFQKVWDFQVSKLLAEKTQFTGENTPFLLVLFPGNQPLHYILLHLMTPIPLWLLPEPQSLFEGYFRLNWNAALNCIYIYILLYIYIHTCMYIYIYICIMYHRYFGKN